MFKHCLQCLQWYILTFTFFCEFKYKCKRIEKFHLPKSKMLQDVLKGLHCNI